MAAGDITVTVTATGTDTRGTAQNFAPTAKVFSSIADVYQREGLNIGTTVQTLLTVGTVAGATLATLSCLIVINHDPTNFVQLGFIDTSAEAFYVKIKPGETFVYMSDELEANATGGAFSAFADIDTITIDADTAACRVSVMAF